MEQDFFWWLESLARSLEYQDRSRLAWAWEVTGASRRQERLQHQMETLQTIGQDHEAAVEPSDEEYVAPDAVPHEHGIAKHYSENGEHCDYPGCDRNYGEGEGLRTPTHVHPEPPKAYVDQAKPVHTFPDNWSVKKTQTMGDLKYEGTMMNNCIKEDADAKGACETCEENPGHCQYCDEGYTRCGDCEGSGRLDCDECHGEGETECETCEATGDLKPCGMCGGKGHFDEGEESTFKGAAGRCTACGGGGKRFHWEPGKVDCDTCHGDGEIDDGKGGKEECEDCDGEGRHECPDCEGAAVHECHECGGQGDFACSSCGGDGRTACWECEGADECPSCHGNSTEIEGGPENYYRPYTHDEAQSFFRAPGGAYSLRDPDNIPHASFLHGENSYGEKGADKRSITDVLGRENKDPKPEYQKRLLQYVGSQLSDKDEKCPTCDGDKVISHMRRIPCEGCGGSQETGEIGNGLVTSDDGVDVHEPCNGRGYTHGPVAQACGHCKGTGEPTVKVHWGYTEAHSTYTKQDIDDIVHDRMPKPDVMLVARHKTNPNEVETLRDAEQGREFAESAVKIKVPCPTCRGESGQPDAVQNSKPCINCGSTGKMAKEVYAHQAYDLYAIPRERVGDSRIEFKPSVDTWVAKDGKGSKIDWDGGTKLDWNQIVDHSYSHGSYGDRMREEQNNRHRELREGQPDYVNRVLPRVAMCRTHDDFQVEGTLMCESAGMRRCSFRYRDLDPESKREYEETYGH